MQIIIHKIPADCRNFVFLKQFIFFATYFPMETIYKYNYIQTASREQWRNLFRQCQGAA